MSPKSTHYSLFLLVDIVNKLHPCTCIRYIGSMCKYMYPYDLDIFSSKTPLVILCNKVCLYKCYKNTYFKSLNMYGLSKICLKWCAGSVLFFKILSLKLIMLPIVYLPWIPFLDRSCWEQRIGLLSILKCYCTILEFFKSQNHVQCLSKVSL